MDKIRTQFVKVRDNRFGSVKSVETRFANILTKLGTHTLVEEAPQVAAPGSVQTPESKASDGKATVPETVLDAMTNQPVPIEVASETQEESQVAVVNKPAQATVEQPQFTEAAKAKPVAAMSTRAMKAAQSEEDEKKKRSYSRRDMKAEK